MIILLFSVKSLLEYLAISVIERPGNCPVCGISRPLWKHASYSRKVLDGSLEHTIAIFRFKCPSRECASVFTLLPAFLVPYRRYSANVQAQVIEGYLTKETTYLNEAAGTAKIEEDQLPLSGSQAFRYVESVARRIEHILFLAQKELVMRVGITSCRFWKRFCPNSNRAKSRKKRVQLNRMAQFIGILQVLLQKPETVLNDGREFFLNQAESIREIFSGRSLRLQTPHNMQPVIF